MRTHSVIRAIALTLTLGAGTHTAAFAGSLPFTWNPSATGDSSEGAFKADRFDISDDVAITVPANPSATGSVSESGYLFPTVFRLGTAVTSTANLTSNTWGIYEDFTATSHLTSCGGGLCGAFDSITASIYEYSTKHGVASVTFSAGVPKLHLPNGADPVLLGTETGPVIDSANTATIQSGVPGASVETLLTPNLTEAAFFVTPTTGLLDLQQAFINTMGVVSTVPGKCKPATTCIYEIESGGGNGNFFRIPEAPTAAIFGTSLIALGFLRYRRHAS